MKNAIWLSWFIMAACAGVAGAGAPDRVMVTPELVSELAEEMRTNNPALRAAQARTNATAAAVAAVRMWENPMFMVGGMGAERMMRAEDGDLMYGIEQELPLFGVPQRKRNVARAEHEVEVSREDAAFQVRRAELAIALFRAALAESVVVIGEKDLHELKTLKQAMEARYRSGGATLVEWTQAQNEHARRATQLQADRDRVVQQRVVLNRLLGRSLLQRWPALELPPLAEPVRFNTVLLDFARKFEPRLRTMREDIRAARATVELTRRERLPEISLGAQARNYSRDGDFRQGELVLRMSLPWFNRGKYRSDLQRDESRVRAAEWDAADYEGELAAEIHELTVKIEAARREAVAYRDEIIPRSEAAVASAQAAWEAGRGMFRDLLEARRMLIEARLMHTRAVAEQYEMLSDLVLCCGLGDLEALKMLEGQLKPDPGESQP